MSKPGVQSLVGARVQRRSTGATGVVLRTVEHGALEVELDGGRGTERWSRGSGVIVIKRAIVARGQQSVPARAREAQAMKAEGKTVEQIAEHFQVSWYTARAWLQACRDADADRSK